MIRSKTELFAQRDVRTPKLAVGVFLLSSISLVQVSLALELFENRIFVREPNGYYLEFFVRKPNCSNSETFENQGLTILSNS